MEFKITEDHGQWDFEWKGQFTRGRSWCRGTEVDLRPSAGLILSEPSGYYELAPASQYKKYIQRLEENWDNEELFYQISDEMSDHDVHLELLRNQSIETTISELGRYKVETKEKFHARFTEANVDLEAFLPDGPREYLNEYNYIVLFKREAIIKELEEALRYGREHNVSFRCV